MLVRISRTLTSLVGISAAINVSITAAWSCKSVIEVFNCSEFSRICMTLSKKITSRQLERDVLHLPRQLLLKG